MKYTPTVSPYTSYRVEIISVPTEKKPKNWIRSYRILEKNWGWSRNMPQTKQEIISILESKGLVFLTTKGERGFKGKQGYAGNSFADFFEFLVVLNDYEHFSNISDPPITQKHQIRYEDVIEIRKY